MPETPLNALVAEARAALRAGFFVITFRVDEHRARYHLALAVWAEAFFTQDGREPMEREVLRKVCQTIIDHRIRVLPDGTDPLTITHNTHEEKQVQ